MANVPISNMTATWTDSGTTYTAIKMNVTDTASNANSLLMDLGTGGGTFASKFKVDKTGTITTATGVINGLNTHSINIGGAGRFTFTSSFYDTFLFSNSTKNVYLSLDASEILAQRNATNAQTFNIYNTYTTTTNYERGFLKWNTNVLQIGTEKGSGGGTARDLAFQTDGTTRLTINSSGAVTASNLNSSSYCLVADNNRYTWSSADISIYRDASNAIGIRDSSTPTNAQTLRVYKSYTDASNYSRLAINNNQIASEAAGTGTLEVTANAPVLNLAQTWNNAAVTFTGLKANVTDTASNAASLLMDLQVGGVSTFTVWKDSTLTALSGTGGLGIYQIACTYIRAGTDLRVGTSNTAFNGYVGSSGILSSVGFGLAASSSDLRSTCDTFLVRDNAANTLGQRNATNAQTFNIYNTYTTTTNYERGFVSWLSNTFCVGTEKGSGGGTARSLQFRTDGVGRWFVDTNGHFTAVTDNSYDIGASGANRPRNIYIAGTIDVGSGNISLASDVRLSRRSSGVLLLDNNGGTDFGRLQFGGTTSSFPALKRSSTTLQVRLADDSAFGPLEASTLTTSNAYTVATLPAAGVAGRRSYVTDATTPTFLGALTGGGAVICPVFDNGTAWVAG